MVFFQREEMREEKRETVWNIRDYYRVSNNVTMIVGAQLLSGVLLLNIVMSSVLIVSQSV